MASPVLPSPRLVWLPVAAVLVGLACRPVDATDTDGDVITDPDGGTAGRLYDVPMSLVWAWSATDGDSTCVDLKIATNGADLRSWALTVTTDATVADISFVEGADIRWIDDHLSVVPSGRPELDGDTSVLAKVCTTPAVKLTDMSAEVVYEEEPDTDVPDASDAFGMINDPALEFGLQFAEVGQDNGGRCLQLDVVNLTSVPVIDWAVEVTFAGPVGQTASEGLWFYQGARPDQIVILPDFDSRTLQPYDSETGVLCLAPFAEPVAIRGGDAPDP